MEIEMQSIQEIRPLKFSQESLESLCNEILNLDSKIRFAGIITDKGKLLAEDRRIGLKLSLEPKDLEMVLMEIALGVRMRREHDAQLGSTRFTISCNESTISMTFPFKKEILFVTAEKEINYSKIPFLILQLLETKLLKME